MVHAPRLGSVLRGRWEEVRVALRARLPERTALLLFLDHGAADVRSLLSLYSFAGSQQAVSA